jgi:hypothetical protein
MKSLAASLNEAARGGDINCAVISLWLVAHFQRAPYAAVTDFLYPRQNCRTVSRDDRHYVCTIPARATLRNVSGTAAPVAAKLKTLRNYGACGF